MGQVRYDNIVKWVLIAAVAIFAIFKLKNCNKPTSDFTDKEIELLNRQKDSLDKVNQQILIEYDTTKNQDLNYHIAHLMLLPRKIIFF